MPEGHELASARSNVVRVGDVVHRAAGPWSASVQALLRHLEAAGFAGAPRVVGTGFDDAGRETLTFIPGDFVHPHPWSDEGIAAVGALLRELHEASRSFTPPPDAAWQPWFTRDASSAVFGHGDVGPWNIVARDGVPVALIDWEFAGPVDRLDEVAHGAWLNCQLHDEIVAARNDLPSPEERARQLRLFADGYGLDAGERAGLVSRMIDFAVRDAANEIDEPGALKMAKRPTGPDDAGWGVAWRVRSAHWLVRHRELLTAALR
ncbi:MAG TPA: phosphotransferase [Acidimicrobiales bacterium]|nr:phosphotransferase [Acidimicrobiales bacterium]